MNDNTPIPEYVTAAIDYGNQVIAAREYDARADEDRRQAKEREERATAWQPVLATIQQATPSWVHEYIVIPDDNTPTTIDNRIDYFYDTYTQPAVIDLSPLIADVPQIRVWAHPHNQNPSILFEAGRYSLVHNDEDAEWYVATRYDNYKVTDNDLHYFQPGSENATDAFHVAFAQAVADRTDLAALQAEAYHLNTSAPVTSGPITDDPVTPDSLQHAENLLAKFARDDSLLQYDFDADNDNHWADNRAVLSAAMQLALAHELRSAATAFTAALERFTSSYENSRPF